VKVFVITLKKETKEGKEKERKGLKRRRIGEM
jgi:hypothetical protein